MAIVKHSTERLAFPKTQKCKYCDEQATKRVIHAEGMAYVPTCDSHLSKAESAVGGKNEVDRVDEIEKTSSGPGAGWSQLGPSDWYTDVGEIECFIEDEGDEVHWRVEYDDGELIDQGVREDMDGAVEEIDEWLQLVSSHNAAMPGGVLPYNPSSNGYLWVEVRPDEYLGVTNDDVNEMHLFLDNYGAKWQVYDDQGLVESGNFSGVTDDQAIFDRANRLLSEFDTNPTIPAKDFSYNPNYNETPNPWL